MIEQVAASAASAAQAVGSVQDWKPLMDFLNVTVVPLLLYNIKETKDGNKEMQKVRERVVRIETTLNIEDTEN